MCGRPMIPLPLVIGGLVLSFVTGAGSSYIVISDHYAAAAAKRVGEAAAAYASRTQDLNDKSAELEGIRNGQRTVYKTIEKRVETYIDRPIYIRECITEPGLRDINAALAGAADPAEPSSGVPAIDATGGKDRRPRPAETD